MKYAIVQAGVVTNVVVANAPLADNWIETDQAGPGWAYDGVSFAAPRPDLSQLASAARTTRNALLAASDWTQVADAPVDQAAWAAYRQALRDITAQAGFPETINWPVAPE